MKFFLLFSLLVSASVHAAPEKTLLACSTPGDAIGAVDVIVKTNGSSVVRVSGLDDSVVEYKIISGLSDLKKKTSTTIIAQGSKSIEFGGAITKSVLLRVLDGQKEARLAERGTVFFLNCNL